MSLFKIFMISAIPLFEQRAAIPLGVFYYHMNPIIVFVISFLGSLLPVPFILLLFNSIFKWMKKYRVFDRLINVIENKIQKNSGKLEKYKEIGLITFVAIPLPTTGLWTGSVVAAFLGLDFRKSFICAAIGGIISAIILTVGCMLFPTLMNIM